MLNRRETLKLASMTAVSAALPGARAQAPADFTLTLAPYTLEVSPHRTIKTIAYNNQVPGPLLRMKEGQPVTIDVVNRTANEELVHWHGLFLPSEVDGAMEEGTPMIPPGSSARYTYTPRPAGLRWYHTHTFAGHDFKRGQYTGQHGFLFIDPRQDAARYDREFFLALHDWDPYMLASDDGSMNAAYTVSTINGRALGFGEPLRVRSGERVLLHLLNSSPTEVHWIALAGHQLRVVALDGNTVPQPRAVPMLRLAPAERVTAVVEMSNPGIWTLGEVRKHIQIAGMGIIVEYANSTGKPQWQQPESLAWNYLDFAAPALLSQAEENIADIPLVFESKFKGHGSMEQWTINGRSYPQTSPIALREGQRYRLRMTNRSSDDHPIHLHRHAFELRRIANTDTSGILKDVVLVPANEQVDVEFTAVNPGATLLHCHQQDHMDMGFMMLFHYA